MTKSFLTGLSIVFIFFLGSTASSGQTTNPDTAKKEFKNIIAVDATPLLRQFFNFNTSSYSYYPFMISYRRLFKDNALRISIAGNIYNDKGSTNDTLPNDQANKDFNIGIGFEHYHYLGKKWNFYYGADLIMNYRYSNYRSSWSSINSWAQTSTSRGYGASPLLGVQFKITSRVSIATETSYDIVYMTTTGSKKYTPSPSKNDSESKNTRLQTTFHTPTTIILRLLF